MKLFLLLISVFGAQGAGNRIKLQFNESKIIIDAAKPLPPTMPYYQPIQRQPSYRILHNKPLNASVSTGTILPNTAAVFTQEEFPRDLLELAQSKLGLTSLEVPSITELADLLGTNNAEKTISYIRQLTKTDQGIALMKAYIESNDYTDSVGGTKNQNPEKSTRLTTTTKPTQNQQNNFTHQMAAFFNIYNIQPQHKHVMEQQLKKITTAPQQIKDSALKNMRPLYVGRNPMPYRYPIPLRPLRANRTALRKQYNKKNNLAPLTHQLPSETHHLNTSKALSPSYIHQLARIANVSPKKLESFLKQKPKLTELAVKLIRFPQSQEHSPQADSQLLAAVRKVMEQDEDLKKLLAANTLL